MTEKILGVLLSFLGGVWIAAVFEGNLLQGNIRGVLGFKSAGHKFAGTFCEAFRIGDDGGFSMGQAVMRLKLRQGQPVVCAFCLRIGKQGWDGECPAAVRASPAGQTLV